MELFHKLFSSLLLFVYHCFDRIVIHGYLSGLSRPEQVVYSFRHVLKVRAITREVLKRRTSDEFCRNFIFKRNFAIHKLFERVHTGWVPSSQSKKLRSSSDRCDLAA